jgi:hypothetical protein
MENESQWYTKVWMLPIYIIILITILTTIINNIPSGKIGEEKKENNNPVNIEKQVEAEKPTQPLSEEDQIKQLVASQFKGKNNNGKDYIIKIKVVEQIDGGWGVFVEYNADDALSASSTKKSIYLDMSKIYTALYTSKKDIRTASVSAYFPVTDKYGNNSDALVYKTMLEEAEADKVNWDIDSSYLGLEILPKVWEITWALPELR